MQAKVKSVKYIKIKGTSEQKGHKTHFSVRGKSESAVIESLKKSHKGFNIIIEVLEWA